MAPRIPRTADAGGDEEKPVDEKPMLLKITDSRAFGAFFLWLIIANTVSMALYDPHLPHDTGWNHDLEMIEMVFLFIFTAEIVLKILAMESSFFVDNWNRMDFVIVLSGYMVFLPGESREPPRAARARARARTRTRTRTHTRTLKLAVRTPHAGAVLNPSVFRTIRVLRPLRAIGLMPGAHPCSGAAWSDASLVMCCHQTFREHVCASARARARRAVLTHPFTQVFAC